MDNGIFAGLKVLDCASFIAAPAAATVLFGEVLDANAALRCGLVWEVVDAEHLEARARSMAARAATADRELLTTVKATMADMRSIDDLDGAVAGHRWRIRLRRRWVVDGDFGIRERHGYGLVENAT